MNVERKKKGNEELGRERQSRGNESENHTDRQTDTGGEGGTQERSPVNHTVPPAVTRAPVLPIDGATLSA